jgi:pyruvate-formate lyase
VKEASKKLPLSSKDTFDLGGTQINMNVMDAARMLEAHKDPGK